MASYGQLSYVQDIPVCSAGMIADLNAMDVVSGIVNSGQTNGIAFGVGVRWNTDGITDELPLNDSQYFHGITVREDMLMQNFPENVASPTAVLLPGMAMALLRKGRIWAQGGSAAQVLGALVHMGTGPVGQTIAGTATFNGPLALTIVVGGALGTATFTATLGGVSTGVTYTTAATVVIGGITVSFPAGTYVAADTYTWAVAYGYAVPAAGSYVNLINDANNPANNGLFTSSAPALNCVRSLGSRVQCIGTGTDSLGNTMYLLDVSLP